MTDLRVLKQLKKAPVEIGAGADTSGPTIVMGEAGSFKSTTAAMIAASWVATAEGETIIEGFKCPDMPPEYNKRVALIVDGEDRMLCFIDRLEKQWNIPIGYFRAGPPTPHGEMHEL